MPVATVLMEMFVWWEAPISMRVEWRCASMTSGGQCVMTTGMALMLLWSANNWAMHTLDVSVFFNVSVRFVYLHLLHVSICAGGRVYSNAYFVAGRVYSNAYFVAGSGPIFLDDVQCSSTSNQLLECSSRPILSHNCLHSADAGVGCEGMFCVPKSM